MISFFKGTNQVFAVATKETISQENCEKLQWLFGDAEKFNSETVNGTFTCLLYTSPSPRDISGSRMPSSA